MNLLSNTFAPINGITSAFNGKQGSLGGVVGGKGCPAKGKCVGCTPFCCVNGEEVAKFITKANLGEAGFNMVMAIIPIIVTLSGALPVVGTAAGVAVGAAIAIDQYILKPLVDWVNFSMNKNSQAAYAKKATESNLYMLSNQLQAMLQTRLPWCDVISFLTKSNAFATNSPIFGSKGPEMGQQFVNLYMAVANEINNARFGKTKQKILEVSQTTKSGEIAEINFREHTLAVKVPNVEHYWMGDIVSLPGMATPVTLMHRWGKSEIYTSDCDRVFVSQRIYPAGNHAHGRGCSLSYSVNSLRQNIKDLPGNYEGLNVRNMYGEGWLYFDMTYQDSHQSMKGQYLDLDNPIYINPEGQVIIPAANTTKNNTPVAATTNIAASTTPVQSASFPVTAISVVAFVGIAAGFIYQSFKND